VIVIIAIACALLVVAAVFVTALTASYAQLEARVDQLDDPARQGVPIELTSQPAPTPVPTGVGGAIGRRAHDLAGSSLDGDAVSLLTVGVEHFTLLAFLSSGCRTCGRFWEALRRDGPPSMGPDTRVVVLTKGPDAESPTELARVADGVDVTLSTEAWRDFEVPGTPFFILVDGPSGTVAGEGTALGWDEVRNLVALGRGDASLVSGVDTSSRKPASDAEREAVVDQILMDAGIFPGDPSLYPGQGEPPDEGRRS
jgi:hypothetical protein